LDGGENRYPVLTGIVYLHMPPWCVTVG